MGTYRPDPYLKPGPNLQFVMWLLLLGLPALLLFMVYAKMEDQAPLKSRPAVEHRAH